MAFRPTETKDVVIEELSADATIPAETQSIGSLIQGCGGADEFVPGTVG